MASHHIISNRRIMKIQDEFTLNWNISVDPTLYAYLLEIVYTLSLSALQPSFLCFGLHLMADIGRPSIIILVLIAFLVDNDIPLRSKTVMMANVITSFVKMYPIFLVLKKMITPTFRLNRYSQADISRACVGNRHYWFVSAVRFKCGSKRLLNLFLVLTLPP